MAIGKDRNALTVTGVVAVASKVADNGAVVLQVAYRVLVVVDRYTEVDAGESCAGHAEDSGDDGSGPHVDN